MTTVATALVSVSDKRGMVEFCRGLAALGVNILSTGGSARALRDGGVAVTEVSAHTNFPEIMDGRVKTLHPKIHAGILARRGRDDALLAEHGITPIDLVAVNLYPFARAAAEPGCDLQRALEHIDIGGPALLRAAAKNHRDVAVLVDAADYEPVLAQLRRAREIPAPMRFELALKAFAHTAGYDGAIANRLGAFAPDNENEDGDFPRNLHLQFRKVRNLRYGENPHQAAALYAADDAAGAANAAQLQGKELSFNNIADADAAFACAAQATDDAGAHACVIVKHANPCGAALAERQESAYERAFATDPESAFGGIIAFNRPLGAAAARAVVARQFAEVIIAPSVSAEARRELAAKADIRVLECETPGGPADADWEYRSAGGGLLVQRADAALCGGVKVVSARAPGEAQMADMQFAWRIAKYVKSNAIVYASAGATVGVGAGQMSRVNSARLAADNARRAGLELRGAVMASDAFLPFRDGLDAAAEVGIAAVIQPGGSRRDDEVIEAADRHGMAMVFTGMRHFRH
ncbi:MAG: bifunctional phosphoribosylaminoimidazolecarboxamide formyltransferase/IMP cyclohydrolase [Gammaproteobacteria bacterium]|nr:bifunctional phosphoribosylaminoimidazolecarboxamide formyltransferase/IMP cyclohydrolase [Gammaproteobacteria bacterium]